MRKRHRSEEHTSELQSHLNLVCRLLLEKKKKLRTDKPRVSSTPLSCCDSVCRCCCRIGATQVDTALCVASALVWCSTFFFFFKDRAPPGVSLFPPPGPSPF